ncbi:MAG: universal stress protein [Bacteroidales bacterium]|nr:universal stress protein [Bacteroidales bacterium]HOY38052.1 universal stress protein [Bacteroidales bacterium]HQP03218.1 universal stress protein [Bacteroidales bacterium]
MEKCILVPWDFTEISNYALEHAYAIGKSSKRPIYLVHVASKSSKVPELLKQLQEIAEQFAAGKDIKVNTAVITGNLFKAIYKFGLENNAYLGVMGTHGIKSLDKAIKLVKKFVKIPFILVQSPVIFGEYDRICIPMDATKKSRAKFQWVRYLSTLFESKAFVIYPTVSDTFRIKTLNNNLRFAEKIFEKDLIDYEMRRVDVGSHYPDAIYDYIREVEADLVLMMTNKYREYIKNLKKHENKDLYKKIPVMCINIRTDIQKLGGFN